MPRLRPALVRRVACALCIALTACVGTYYDRYLVEHPGWVANLPEAGIDLEQTVAALYAPFEGRSRVSVRRLVIMRTDVEPWQFLDPRELSGGSWKPAAEADYAVAAHFVCTDQDGAERFFWEGVAWYLLRQGRLSAWRHTDWLEDFPCAFSLSIHVARGEEVATELRLREWVAKNLPAPPAWADQLYLEGIDLARAGRYAEARERLERGDAAQRVEGVVARNLARFDYQGGFSERLRASLEEAVGAAAAREHGGGGEAALELAMAGSLGSVLGHRMLLSEARFREPVLQAAVNELRADPDADRRVLARALAEAGRLRLFKGDVEGARKLQLEALTLRMSEEGPDSRAVAASLAGLADADRLAGDLDLAERRLAQAAAIVERLPEDLPLGADLLELDGLLRLERGDARAARERFLDLLKLRRVQWSRDGGSVSTLPLVAMAEIALGDLGSAGHRLDVALRLADRQAEVAEFSGHAMLAERALVADLSGDLEAAVEWQRRSLQALEDRRVFAFLVGDEVERRAAAAAFEPFVEYAVGLALRAGSAAGADSALEALLSSKGRLLDAELGERDALRGDLDAETEAAAGRVAEARRRLDELTRAGPGNVDASTLQAASDVLREATGSLQSSLRAGHARHQRGLLDRVTEVLPAQAALVEFTLYRPFERADIAPTLRGVQRVPRRYAGCVLRWDGLAGCADLGSADDVDREIAALRRSLSSPLKLDVRTRGRALHRRLLEPLATLTAGVRELVVSPEGALNLVPFAVLVGADDRLLVESTRLGYLTSGRDLLRTPSIAPETPGVFIGDPDFELETAPSDRAVEPSRSSFRSGSDTFDGFSFARLPGTAAEVRDLAAVVPGATIWTRADATESAVKGLRRPELLHIATHGFFLPDGAAEAAGLLSALTGVRPRGERSLLRSGLALAGANRRAPAGEDGILTALELSRLDLAGTRLVTLSACETGLGEVAVGEGVYGLRRAVLLAGAQAQLTSLWKVNDEATRELMSRYYLRLARNEGHVESLREVQLEMKADSVLSHPYYWAGFIPIGTSSSLDGAGRR